MREATGNLWTYPADARVITTNGTVRRDGECVMGKGVAAQAKKKWPKLPRLIGALIQNYGNKPFLVDLGCLNSAGWLLTLPVKHQWFQKADIFLIKRGLGLLIEITNEAMWNTVILVRPGCGNGGLDWKDVKPILEEILDDRFTVVFPDDTNRPSRPPG